MAQLAHNISNELLSCKICFCQFSKTKLPKLLACPHTFCEPCLKKMVKRARLSTGSAGHASGSLSEHPSGQVDHIICPVCREVTFLKEQGIQGLANNLTILTLMDMISTQQSPDQAASPTRTRLASPEEGIGRCIQCNKRFPESQFLCGHCICDNCLECYLLEHGQEDKCPVCKPTSRGASASGNSFHTDTSLGGACGTSASMSCRPKQPKPTPAPRSHQKQSGAISNAPDQLKFNPAGAEKPKPSCNVVFSLEGPPTPPARPPPFNPSYLETPASGASACGLSPPKVLTHRTTSTSVPFPERPKRSISPYGAAAAGFSQAGNRRPPDPDNLSLCSVASESRISTHTHDSPVSTLRRSQSMRRPPPPPQRKYGTLTRQTLAPPQQAIISRSAENVREQTHFGENTTGGRQRNSISEGASSGHPPSAPVRASPPVPPPRRIFKNQTQSPTKCVKKFGSYSEVTLQTNCFRNPSRVAMSENGDIVITDTRNMTVQLFTLAGDYIALFKVLGVQDACFLTVDKLCVASHMGVHVYATSGHKLTDIQMGPTIAVEPYKFGFIAATPKSLHIYRQSFTLVKEINKFKSVSSKKWSPIHKKTQSEFHSIRDIAVTPTRNIAVLDGSGSSWTIHILGEDGVASAKIDPASLSCGALSDPEAITSDFSNNIYVTDTDQHRVLKFTAAGSFQKCVVSFSGREPNTKKIFPRGLCVTETGHVVVGITGDHVAEIRIYSQVS